ncbi:hypothetical protein AB0B92_13695 [Streptomyces hygroscopicus]|uniref:hypothetical protein n=1 Tax=Streptomyces hygroscopicus TaxID=1912 RepID=UPI00340A99DA
MSVEIRLLSGKSETYQDVHTQTEIRNYRYQIHNTGALEVQCTTTTADSHGYAVDRTDTVEVYGPAAWEKVSDEPS